MDKHIKRFLWLTFYCSSTPLYTSSTPGIIHFFHFTVGYSKGRVRSVQDGLVLKRLTFPLSHIFGNVVNH